VLKESVVVAFGAPETDPTSGSTDHLFHIACDQDRSIYYLVLCTYINGITTKIYVAPDPVKGVTVC
jgi:hypothetical protein